MVDEVVFHQLLHWHHFYDRSTTAAVLLAAGVGLWVRTAHSAAD